MTTPYSHRNPSPRRTGEWDTPLHHRSSTDTPTALTPATRQGSSRDLVRQNDVKPVYSQLKQQVLSEDDYLLHLSRIIQRDFFPHLASLESRNEVLDAFESRDQDRIGESVRRMRELDGTTPRVRTKYTERRDQTPGRTPYSLLPDDSTPTHFDRTPMTCVSSSSALTSISRRPAPPDPIAGLTLDTFQSRYTSEDNSSFADLVQADNAARREKHAWAWEAERKANQKAIRGREARERLVDITKRMVEKGGGEVRMLEGSAGRPGERRLLVTGDDMTDEGRKGGQLMIKGRDEKERLLLTAAGEGSGKDEKGKGKEVAVRTQDGPVDEKAKQYVDWDRTTVEEEEERKMVGEEELQVQIGAWPFKNRNSLMFPPDADRYAPSSLLPHMTSTTSQMPPPAVRHPSSHPSASSLASQAPHEPTRVIRGEKKGIRYNATRLEDLERPRRRGSGAESVAGSDWTETTGTSGPSRSRIGAAVAGTPYPGASSSSSTIGATPRVAGFSFVDALPAPSASSLPPQALQELMTWGTIEATPVTLRSSAYGDGDGESAVGPFHIRERDRREELAHRMAKKAKRSLAESSSRGKGLAVDARPGGASALHRSVLDASIRSNTSTSRTPSGGAFSPHSGVAASPRPSADSLTPAARTLLSRTRPGKALEGGLGRTKAWGEDEERRRVERARVRAREVEGRERLRRERWTPSPAPSLGFDPDLSPPPRDGIQKRRTLK
ncbi:hypothetical protein JCM11251_007927 [Rhodosporidiobolus azoricus]